MSYLFNIDSICISLITKDVDQFLGASQPFSIPKLRILCLALYPIINRVIWFLESNFLSSLYILILVPYLI